MQPVASLPAELLLRAQGVRVLLLDVDGVMTDGGLHYGPEGEVLKRFHVQDGLGLVLLRRCGIVPAVVSGRDGPPLQARLRELGIEQARCGVADKLAAAQSILTPLGLDWTDAAAMGDDWPDLPLLRRCAFSAAPADAHVEVRAAVHHVTPRAGGHGAVRDLCDLLMMAAGAYAGQLRGAAS